MAESLEIIRGDDISLPFTYKDADGVAIDITGYTIFFTAKAVIDDDVTDADAVIKKDVTSHTNPTGGESLITLTDADTNVAPQNYLADIQLKDDSGNIASSGQFFLKVIADVTRRIT